jgi:hypothetical protein
MTFRDNSWATFHGWMLLDGSQIVFRGLNTMVTYVVAALPAGHQKPRNESEQDDAKDSEHHRNEQALGNKQSVMQKWANSEIQLLPMLERRYLEALSNPTQGRASTLISLPAELRLIIEELCDTPAQKNLRATCRLFTDDTRSTAWFKAN